MASRSQCHLRVDFALACGLLVTVHLPVGDDAVVFVAGRRELALLPRSPVQNVLGLLEVLWLPLHVQAAERDLRLGWVVYVVLFRTHVEQHLLWPLVREASRMSREIARHFSIQVLQVPSIDAPAFLRVRRAVLQLWIIESPTAVSHYLILFARLKVRVLRLLRLVEAGRIRELTGLERVQSLLELLLNADIGLPYLIHGEIRTLAVATPIPSLKLAIALINITVVPCHRCSYSPLMNVIQISRLPVKKQSAWLVVAQPKECPAPRTKARCTYTDVTFCRFLTACVRNAIGTGPETVSILTY